MGNVVYARVFFHVTPPSFSSPGPVAPIGRFSLAGVSRSVTLVVAYIMTVTGMGWQEALAAVKAVRPCAGPNLGFQRQLQEFEATQAGEVRGPHGSRGMLGTAGNTRLQARN